ncbi:50S ribosome-binding GTPase [Aeromicrobium panaciterrae]|uniref:GTPase n=1 Tax=Aeromicrobium panaciterrae TaxID=363861 RepID=UPI0031DA3EA1
MSTAVHDAQPTFAGEPSDVSKRLDGLTQAVAASRGRIDEEILAPAEMLAGRANERLRLSGEHTIVALAGATGSGKSSLFNALTDLELAGVGVRRPTTSWALACAWGPDGAQGLLEWMGIPPRHQVSRLSMLDRSAEDTKLDGLVLLDLPDHDSTEVSHHLEMDRLVKYADLLVWVLDPQKYADAALHDRYIRPMASYSDVTVVVLNQIDRIPYEQRTRTLEDVRRILAAEGLPDVEVVGVSATRGDGIEDLKRLLATRIRAKASAKGRLGSDITAAAQVIAQVGGTHQVPGISPADRRVLDDALVSCAGVPQVVDAIAAATRRQAILRTGWPVARWLGKLRRDPLKGLMLDSDMSMTALARASLPEASPVQRANAELAIRDLAEKASVGLEHPWRDAVRAAASPPGHTIVDDLDAAIAATHVRARTAWWWRVVQVIQWLAMLGLIAGLGWLAAQGLQDSVYPDMSLPELKDIAGFPAAAVVAAGSAAVGIVLGLLSRVFARLSGRRRARNADRQLREAIDSVAVTRVVAPVQAELDAYGAYRTGILAALG